MDTASLHLRPASGRGRTVGVIARPDEPFDCDHDTVFDVLRAGRTSLVKKVGFGCGTRRDQWAGVKVSAVKMLPIGSEISCRVKAWLKSCLPDEAEERDRAVRAV